jgi:hypothetical protein
VPEALAASVRATDPVTGTAGWKRPIESIRTLRSVPSALRSAGAETSARGLGEPHQDPSFATYDVEARQQPGDGVELGDVLVPADADVGRVDSDDRSAGVDQRDRHLVYAARQDVALLAGGEEPSGASPGGVHETHAHRSAGERDAGDALGRRLVEHAPGSGHALNDQLARVGVEDTHGRLRRIGAYPSFPDRERRHHGRAVAAVASPVHLRLVDSDLGERVLHVHTVDGRLSEDDRLARGRGASAHAVDLPVVRAAVDAQQHLVDRQVRNLQLVAPEDPALAGPSPHPRRGDLAHSGLLS